VKGLLRLGALGLVVGAVALLASRIPLNSVPEHVRELGGLGPVAGAATGAALLMALVPRTAISLACGLLFGALAGAGIAVVAAVVAAAATFGLGRWAGRTVVEGKIGGRIARLDTWLARRGTLAVLVVRLLPLAPFGLMGYAYGTSSTAFRHYIVGTSVGAAPSAFAYAAIGSAVVAGSGADLLTYLPAVIGGLISFGALLYWRLRPAQDPHPRSRLDQG
jgi:uncharacterized membrane protein YdjX (TVP38/TMEM64 family)